MNWRDDRLSPEELDLEIEKGIEGTGWTGYLVHRECRRCGCTDQAACAGGCTWVLNDLCSQCAEELEACAALGFLFCVHCYRTGAEVPGEALELSLTVAATCLWFRAARMDDALDSEIERSRQLRAKAVQQLAAFHASQWDPPGSLN